MSGEVQEPGERHRGAGMQTQAREGSDVGPGRREQHVGEHITEGIRPERWDQGFQLSETYFGGLAWDLFTTDDLDSTGA